MKYDLKKVKKVDYDKFLEETIRKLSVLNFIVSIFKFGEIRFPGISDIDLLIVIDDLERYEDKKLQIKEIIYSITNSRYLLFHDPIIVPQNDLLHIDIFHSTENLSLIFGQKIPINSTKNEFREISIAMWNSYFYQKLIVAKRDFANISERRLLLLLNNLAICVKNNDRILGTNIYNDYRKKVENLRSESLADEKAIQPNHYLEILKEGISLLNFQESKRVTQKRFLPVLNIKDRHIFIPWPNLHYWNFKIISISTLPSYYFTMRDELIKFAQKFDKNKVGNKNSFLDIRERFNSVKIMGF